MESVSHALAGATGGVIAMALLYPLENVRVRLQVQVNEKQKLVDNIQHGKNKHKHVDTKTLNDVIRYNGSIDCIRKVIMHEGITSLYTGMSSALIGVGVSSAVYFYWYNSLKSIVLKYQNKSSLTPLYNIGVASTAGVLNVFVTMPIWVINTRMTLNKSNRTIFSTIRDIIEQEGWLAFYKGLIPSLILVSNPAIQFVVYEQLIRVLSKQRGNTSTPIKLSASQSFVLGAIAKAVATVLTYPYQVIKSRQQAVKGKDISTSELIKQMYAEEGISVFFNGMNAKMSQTVTNSAFMFLIYEQLVRIILVTLQHTIPSATTQITEKAKQIAVQPTNKE